MINKYRSRAEDWAEINALHTKAAEQAGFDRNLFENASNKHRYVNVSYPEYASTSPTPLYGTCHRAPANLLPLFAIGPSNPTRPETFKPDSLSTWTMLWSTTRVST